MCCDCEREYLNLEIKLYETELVVNLINDSNQGSQLVSSATIDLELLKKALDNLNK
jgi:hypothetical protein